MIEAGVAVFVCPASAPPLRPAGAVHLARTGRGGSTGISASLYASASPGSRWIRRRDAENPETQRRFGAVSTPGESLTLLAAENLTAGSG